MKFKPHHQLTLLYTSPAEAARGLGVLVEVGFSELTSGYMVIYRDRHIT